MIRTESANVQDRYQQLQSASLDAMIASMLKSAESDQERLLRVQGLSGRIAVLQQRLEKESKAKESVMQSVHHLSIKMMI